MIGLIGKKLGMSQVFAANGTLVPVTVIQVGPCTVVQKKTVERDGYTALQLGFGVRKPRRATKPLLDHCKAARAGPLIVLREFLIADSDPYEIGCELTAAQVFHAGVLLG